MSAQVMQTPPSRLNPRVIQQIVRTLDKGGVIAYPTDTIYGIGCDLHNRKAIERIQRIKRVKRGHPFTFVCESFSQISEYAHLSDVAFRLLKRILPGPYTIVLPATRAVPKILVEKRREVGVRMPQHPVCEAIVQGLGRPIISTSATDPADGSILNDPHDLELRLGKQLDVIADSGPLWSSPSTVLRLDYDEVEVIREGAGPTEGLF